MADQPRTAKEWFEDADRHFVEAVQRVMTASTGIEPFAGPRLDWTPFREEMARLQQYAEMRHAAKHAARVEAMYYAGPVTVYRDGSGRT